MPNIVTRFAPSPTGYLHLGGLRTALYSYFWAKKNNGRFILRIEDTDQKRLVAGAEEKLLAVLASLGLELEADKIFRQSERLDLYQRAAADLIQTGWAYKCYCSAERLEELRVRQSADHEVPRYDGRCRDLSAAEISRHQGEPHTVRFKIPAKRTIHVRDLIRGTIQVESQDLDDFILLKSDGWPTYHLAVVVDDNAMGVTQVIRAEEWLPSLPKHALLYEAFGYQLPEFIHLAHLLNADKSKLSKRQGDVAVEDYLAQGYLPAALINYVALLGWHPADNREFFTFDELVREFSLDRLQKSGAIFDKVKLNWYNAHYIRQFVTAQDQHYQELVSFVRAQILPQVEDALLARIMKVYAARLDNLSLLRDLTSYIFSLPDYQSSLLIFKKSSLAATRRGLQAMQQCLDQAPVTVWSSVEQLEVLLKKSVTDVALSFGDALWPMRVALAGVEQSPSPSELAWILGREETMRRLLLAGEKLESMV